MTSTQDNVMFEQAMSDYTSEFAEKPFLHKELQYVIDNNGSDDYSRNQLIFETISISNNGKFADYRNGFISIPMVAVMRRTAHHLDETEGFNALKFKNSNLVHIDSMAVEYGNDPAIQQRQNFSAYCIFKQHTELSLNDVEINGPTMGYHKESNNWNFDDVTGMTNSGNDLLPVPFTKHDPQQQKIISTDNLRRSGVNYYKKVGDDHVYYYDCIIRLKDLLFFDKMPSLLRGANIKLTLILNQSETVVKVDSDVKTSVVNTLRGSTNPMLRTNESYGVADVFTETMSCKVVKNGNHIPHVKNQCRLYVPTYILSPAFEKQYLDLGQKKIIYEDIFTNNITVNANDNFQILLTNSLSRMKRLVIIPMIDKSANGSTLNSPQESVYATEPCTTSPTFIRDFNVSLSGTNIYSNNIQYKYESFLNELNGNFGVNSNLETGVCSSLISMEDYNNNYGYIVVDLSRRYNFDEKTPLSVEIKGFNEGVKQLQFMCFITYTKEMTVNLNTGARIE
jgi:hypothetical protein